MKSPGATVHFVDAAARRRPDHRCRPPFRCSRRHRRVARRAHPRRGAPAVSRGHRPRPQRRLAHRGPASDARRHAVTRANMEVDVSDRAPRSLPSSCSPARASAQAPPRALSDAMRGIFGLRELHGLRLDQRTVSQGHADAPGLGPGRAAQTAKPSGSRVAPAASTRSSTRSSCCRRSAATMTSGCARTWRSIRAPALERYGPGGQFSGAALTISPTAPDWARRQRRRPRPARHSHHRQRRARAAARPGADDRRPADCRSVAADAPWRARREQPAARRGPEVATARHAASVARSVSTATSGGQLMRTGT